jgi:glycosyltransferase involved in cell wall biosynthesis
MKVLHWLNTFLPDPGGIQSFCADLLPELMDRDHEVLLLTAHTGVPLPDHSMHGRIEVRRVDSLRALVQRDPGQILRAKIEIAHIVDTFDPDLIHLHPCGPELVYFHQIRRKRPTPTILTLHNNYSSIDVDFGQTGSFGRVFGPAQRIAAVSDDARRWLLSLRPELAEKTSTIHNGLPVSRAEPAPLPWAPPRLLYVGRIEAQKRLDVLVQAFATVASSHRDVRLQIAGAGTQLGTVTELARSLGLAERVEFLGAVELESVPGLLDGATMLVMSSDFEGLPIVLLEAARQGRPAVATAVGGVPEVVAHGETGLLVEPDAPDALAGAIATLLDDPRRAERFGDAARRRFLADFSLDACATAYERLYEEAVAETAEDGRAVAS